jgi:Holliday junction DNA helicase RuvB
MSDTNTPEDLYDETELPDEQTLRPDTLADFTGQRHVVEPLGYMIEAARQRGEPLGHVLFSGPPGLGKTTLARIIANALGAKLTVCIGPALKSAMDMAGILAALEPGEVLFIDEIHRLPRHVEELLYPALEDYQVQIVVGSGPEARSMALPLPRFTCVGATTRTGLISAPLRDRFTACFQLEHYNTADLCKVLERAERIMGVHLEPDAREHAASYSRGTPRIALRLLQWCRDVAQLDGVDTLDLGSVQGVLEAWGIGPLGLDRLDRAILRALVHTFQGEPVGLGTLASVLHEEQDTIAEEHEPQLMKLGLMKRTPRGRVATEAALRYLGGERDSIVKQLLAEAGVAM